MKKLLSFLLSIMLVFTLLPIPIVFSAPGEPQSNPFSPYDSDNNGNYIVNTDLTLTENVSLNSGSGSLTINSEVTLTISPGVFLEIQGMPITNNGTITILTDQDQEGPNEGRLEIRNIEDIQGELVNNGTITINGRMEVISSKFEIANEASVIVGGWLRLAEGSTMTNDGTITGTGNGSIMLDNPAEANLQLTITGLDFYESSDSVAPTADINGQFNYGSDKWVRQSQESGPGPEPGPGPDSGPEPEPWGPYDVTIVQPVNGTVKVSGMDVSSIQASSETPVDLTVTPNEGYKIETVIVTIDGIPDDWSWNLSYNGDGSYNYPLENLPDNMNVEFVFAEQTSADLDYLLHQTYVILDSETANDDAMKTSLSNQFGGLNVIVPKDDIIITSDVKGDFNNGYKTFEYTFKVAEKTSETQTGYIVEDVGDVIFKLVDDSSNTEIVVAKTGGNPGTPVEVPAFMSGTMEIFGYNNLIAMPFEDEERIDGKFVLPFNRMQLHIVNGFINLYGIYVIQSHALCLEVAAKSGISEEKTCTWELGRYADVTTGNYTSFVFFGNDRFTLQPPADGIGGIDSLMITADLSPGYILTETSENNYSIQFLSDYYDTVVLNLTITKDDLTTVTRQLTVQRTGVHIEPYTYDGVNEYYQVGHGTQSGTQIKFTPDNHYQVYGTYYIPHFGNEPPYGLFVTYTWSDGTKTTKIITAPCNEPVPRSKDHFSDGVFFYENGLVNACDYLLYSGPDKESAPTQINVIVLKGDPTATESFNGVFFGSGNGVTWDK